MVATEPTVFRKNNMTNTHPATNPAARIGGILDRLQQDLDGLPNALARIAKYILENPEKVLHQSVAELGEFSGSGEASIVRLCRHIGFAGFRDFKLALAAEVGRPRLGAVLAANPDTEMCSLHDTMLESLAFAHAGGQRQRVALARAMAREPGIFLMDEPLSNLDAKLRVAMRSEIVDLNKRLGATFLFVTHDQSDAMAMSDRIALMMGGRIRQIGTPQEIYETPGHIDVATFIGQPAINLFPAEIDAAGRIGLAEERPPFATCTLPPGRAQIGVRAEAFEPVASIPPGAADPPFRRHRQFPADRRERQCRPRNRQYAGFHGDGGACLRRARSCARASGARPRPDAPGLRTASLPAVDGDDDRHGDRVGPAPARPDRAGQCGPEGGRAGARRIPLRRRHRSAKPRADRGLATGELLLRRIPCRPANSTRLRLSIA
ncbi:ATP-binding cassette domain-containing protein [Rhizobium binxianense]